MRRAGIFLRRGTVSPTRRGMLTATYEGVVAVVLSNLLAAPFLTAYLLHLGANSQQIGLVMAIPALANLLQVFAAAMMQRYSNRKLVYTVLGTLHRVFGISTGAIPFLFPQELWIPVYIVVFAVSSVCGSLLGVVWTSLISDMVPARVRGRYFGIRNVLGSAAGSLFVFLMGVLLERYPGAEGFQLMYWLGFATVVLNIYMFMLYPNPPFEKSQSYGISGLLSAPLRDREFFRALLFLTCWTLLLNLAHPFISYVMLDVMQLGYQWVSVLTILQKVASMAGFLVWGNLSVRYDNRTLLLWSLPILAVSCLLWGAMAVVPAAVVLVIVNLLTGFGAGAYSQVVFIFVIGDTPKAERPAYIAVYAAITGLAGFFGPTLGGTIFNWLENAPLWVQSYGVFTAVGAVMLALGWVLGPRVFRSGKPVAAPGSRAVGG